MMAILIQASPRAWIDLVVPSEATVVAEPCEGSLHDPTPWQKIGLLPESLASASEYFYSAQALFVSVP